VFQSENDFFSLQLSYQGPIIYWFKAMWWFTTRKSGVNAANLKDLLGLGSYALPGHGFKS
jgi:hypothetical protein